jgi:hypothetical protein
MVFETLRNPAPFFLIYLLGKIPAVIQSDLYQAKTVTGSKLQHPVERPACGKAGESKATLENAISLPH